MARFIYFADSAVTQVDEGQIVKIAVERSGVDLDYRDYVRYILDDIDDYKPDTTAYASDYQGEGDISYAENVSYYGGEIIFEPGETIKYATLQANPDFEEENTEYAEVHLRSHENDESEVWDPEYYVNGGEWYTDDYYEFGEPRSKVIAIKDLPYKEGLSNQKPGQVRPSNSSNETLDPSPSSTEKVTQEQLL